MSFIDLLTKSKMEREKNVRNKVAIAATIGVTVGAVAGVLLAPKSGKETREDLVKKVQELPEKVKELSEKTEEMLGEVKEKIAEETQKITSGVKSMGSEIKSDIANELDEDSRFQQPSEITEEQVNAFKKKLT